MYIRMRDYEYFKNKGLEIIDPHKQKVRMQLYSERSKFNYCT